MASSVPVPLALGRFKQLPQRSTEVWQGGLVKLPVWIDDPDDPEAPPHRASGAFWASARTGLIHVDLPSTLADLSPQLALSALLDFGLKHAKQLEGRPARLEVADPAVRDQLADALAGMSTDVVVVPDLPLVRAALDHLEEHERGGIRPRGLLEMEGMTIERMRAFADAAARFHRARPWDHLANEDLIVVDAPGGPSGWTGLSVLGQGGEQFGLAFYDNREALEELLDPAADPRQVAHARGVTFGPIDDVPFADVDAWQEHGLPLAGANAYPLAGDLHIDGRLDRPDAATLTWIEGLLRAITATTEDDLDAGRWERTVDTFDGPVTLTLTLPFLLEEEAGLRSGEPQPAAMVRLAERSSVRIERLLEGRNSPSLDEVNALIEEAQGQGFLDRPEGDGHRPLTPLEQAQELCYDAMGASGRRQIKLARQALALSADCADAWGILGGAAARDEVALDCYQRGVEAGARAIGPDAFATLTGEFWERVSTRPYMRARLALAQELFACGREDEAIEHYRALLELNPNDNQGVRHLLLPALLQRGDDDACGALIEQYQDDIGALWPYARALWLFRTAGDTDEAREALSQAIRVNPHVAKFMARPDTMPPDLAPHYTLGSKDEGAIVADQLLDAVDATPGAAAWIRSRSRLRRKDSPTSGKRDKRARR